MSRFPASVPIEGVSFETALFALFADEGFVCIKGAPPYGRYSLIAVNPSHTLKFSGGFITMDGHTVIDNPKEALKRFSQLAGECGYDPNLPLGCGAVGYLNFEAARAVRGYAPARGFSRYPQCYFGIYPTSVVFDHVEGTARILSDGGDGVRLGAVSELKVRLEDAPRIDASGIEWKPVFTSNAASRIVSSRARDWLRADKLARFGAVQYESMPIRDSGVIDALIAPRDMSTRALFVHEGAYAVVSSDEAILTIDGDSMSSTVAASLQTSIKEHETMLGRICTEDGLIRIDSPASVTFTGERRRELSPIESLMRIIPTPAATGAPFDAAMRFIDDNEEAHRSFCGGAFGTFGADRLSFMTIKESLAFVDGAVTRSMGTEITV